MDVDFVIAYEAGELDDDTIVAGFQAGIDSGLVWQLQGHYGRTAAALIEQGLCHLADELPPLPTDVDREEWAARQAVERWKRARPPW